MSVLGDPASLNRGGTGPLPHPTTQPGYAMGGRVGERAGAVPSNVKNPLKSAGFRPFNEATRAEILQ